MVPKIIHWTWFGDKNKIPIQFQQNLESWKRFFPDYEIKCWDESNYDINKNDFTKKQYQKGNFSFVSDFARLDIVYQYGGLYFDIDVEVIKPFDDLPEQFFGFEACTFGINPGSGFGCEAGHPLFKQMLDSFNTNSVIGNYFNTGIMTTEEPSLTLVKNGLICDNTYQIIQKIHFLPCEFLCPFFYDEVVHITLSTVSIHKYAMTWLTDEQKIKVMKIRNNNIYLKQKIMLNDFNNDPVLVEKEFSYEPM
jgi:mannosyltransferase OCH1-like enzyme